MKKYSESVHGLSMIEVLSIAAFIAALVFALIPSLIKAQTWAKVSRVKNDFKALAVALEAYAVDNNDHYPPSSAEPTGGGSGDVSDYILPLSTPIAYITTARYKDPFGNPEVDNIGLEVDGKSVYFYVNQTEGDTNADAIIQTAFPPPDPRTDKAYRRRWMINSAGPDRRFEITVLDPNAVLGYIRFVDELDRAIGIYDPTNGTWSRGDIGRSHQGMIDGKEGTNTKD